MPSEQHCQCKKSNKNRAFKTMYFLLPHYLTTKTNLKNLWKSCMSHNLKFISPLLPLAKEMDWWDFIVARGWSFITITGLCQPQINLESISEVGTSIGWVVTPDGMVMMRLIISRRIPQLYVGKGKTFTK
jgi:hypothetical protein